MSIGERIKKQRLLKGLTLEDVAKHLGVARQTIQKYEMGIISNIPSDKIEKLSEVLGVTPAYLMNWENQPQLKGLLDPVPKTYTIPLIGTIACGAPILAVENHEDYVDVPEHIHADFALRCKGDSMIDARIHDGDIVYIRVQPIVENGQIAAIQIGDNEATLKRVYITTTHILLQAANPKYEPIVYTGAEMNNVKILGLAVGFTSVIL